MKAPAAPWRYSLSWGLPHVPCPGPAELIGMEVPAGAPCPSEVESLWRPGTGYIVSIDFGALEPVKRWSEERRATTRRRNLARRVANAVPLFAEEFEARELAARPEYFQGKYPGSASTDVE